MIKKARGHFFKHNDKLNRDVMVAIPILDRICETLNVDYGDIVEHVDEQPQATKL